MTQDPPGGSFPVDRRRFLHGSAWMLGGLAAGSSVLMTGCNGHYAALLPTGAVASVLSEKELAVLHALALRVVPADGDAPGAETTRVAERIDRELKFHHAQLVSDFKAALLLVEHGGVLHGVLTRFSRMNADEQDARLHQMSTGTHALERQAFSSLRLLVVFFHHADERTWPHIGYQGPLVTTAKPPPADSRARGPA